MGRRHEKVRDLIIMATRATQSANIPGVDHLRFAGREERYGGLEHTARPTPGTSAVMHYTAAEHPIAMQDATAVGPAPGHAVTSFRNLGPS